MMALFIISICFLLGTVFFIIINYFEDKEDWLSGVMLLILVISTVGMLYFASELIPEYRQPKLDKSYKQGQIDALNGDQHYESIYIYHNSTLVDTIYTLKDKP